MVVVGEFASAAAMAMEYDAPVDERCEEGKTVEQYVVSDILSIEILGRGITSQHISDA